MRALVLSKDPEPFPIREEAQLISTYEGILNSNFKKVATKNFFHSNPHSIFGIKQRVKSAQYQITSHVDTILKLSVFAVVLGLLIL